VKQAKKKATRAGRGKRERIDEATSERRAEEFFRDFDRHYAETWDAVRRAVAASLTPIPTKRRAAR